MSLTRITLASFATIAYVVIGGCLCGCANMAKVPPDSIVKANTTLVEVDDARKSAGEYIGDAIKKLKQ